MSRNESVGYIAVYDTSTLIFILLVKSIMIRAIFISLCYDTVIGCWIKTLENGKLKSEKLLLRARKKVNVCVQVL